MHGVAPHAGAWIEIVLRIIITSCHSVAPHAGAWIEIVLPSAVMPEMVVAPHAGAWIEIESVFAPCHDADGVAPHAGEIGRASCRERV